MPPSDPVDYVSLVGEFNAWGVAGLSASNGLTAEENRRLFKTPHVIEMVALVLRGLLRVFTHGPEYPTVGGRPLRPSRDGSALCWESGCCSGPDGGGEGLVFCS